MLLSPFSLASKVQIFHPFARCFCACFRGLYKPYWKGFPLRMLKTLLKAWKTRLYGQFSTVSGGVFNILWKTFQHNSTDKHPRSLGKLPVLPPFLRVKLTIITGVLPVFSLSTGFPHPVCGQKAKSSSCMLNAKIPHKIPSCSGHSGCCKPVRRSPQNGRGIAAPAAVFDHHRHRKPRLLHRPIPDEHRVCVVGAIRQRARQLGAAGLAGKGNGRFPQSAQRLSHLGHTLPDGGKHCRPAGCLG